MMTFDPDIHHRRSIRLKEYDYSGTGAYFVTLCTWQRECLFGEICLPVGAGSKPALESEQPSMIMNEFGKMIEFTWHDLPNHTRNIRLDTFIIMPNHIHGIVVIEDRAGLVRAGYERAGLEPAPTLSEIVRQFKTFSSRRINKQRDNPGCPVWQRNYHERVIRDEKELSAIRAYIENNPRKWDSDKNNPRNIKEP
jgi:REP element-mobilizing transposase RayT